MKTIPDPHDDLPAEAERSLQPLPVSSRTGGLMPGIDILSNKRVLDVVDEEKPAEAGP
jgi:hypothetical protein